MYTTLNFHILWRYLSDIPYFFVSDHDSGYLADTYTNSKYNDINL